jgi:hypothetical protein
MSAIVRVIVLFFLVLEFLSAQVASSTITGTVQDASGAVIPNAKVTITEQARAASREVVTNGRGEFSSPNLQIGQYTVTVTVPGFKTQVFNDIVLVVDKVLNLPVTLQPGVVTESIEVTGGAPLIDTATSSLAER